MVTACSSHFRSQTVVEPEEEEEEAEEGKEEEGGSDEEHEQLISSYSGAILYSGDNQELLTSYLLTATLHLPNNYQAATQQLRAAATQQLLSSLLRNTK